MRLGNGLSNAHNDFPDEMAKKTVTRRALKIDTKSSGDDTLFGKKESPVQQEPIKIEKFETVEIVEPASINIESETATDAF